jgi:hypothetical protein
MTLIVDSAPPLASQIRHTTAYFLDLTRWG